MTSLVTSYFYLLLRDEPSKIVAKFSLLKKIIKKSGKLVLLISGWNVLVSNIFDRNLLHLQHIQSSSKSNHPLPQNSVLKFVLYCTGGVKFYNLCAREAQHLWKSLRPNSPTLSRSPLADGRPRIMHQVSKWHLVTNQEPNWSVADIGSMGERSEHTWRAPSTIMMPCFETEPRVTVEGGCLDDPSAIWWLGH